MHKSILYLERKLAGAFLKLLKKTMRFQTINMEKTLNIRCVYAFWHRDLVIGTLQRSGERIAVMVSLSLDGELIAGPIQELGYIPVRGSSSRNGSEALKTMLRLSKEIDIGITPDGPKGPIGTIHPGIFQLALLGKIPIVAIAFDIDKEWIFNSWDRFRFPKPFSKVTAIYSDPIWVHTKNDIPQAEQSIRDFKQNQEQSFMEQRHEKHNR